MHTEHLLVRYQTELMAKSRIDAVAGRIPDAVTRDLLLSEE